MARGERSTKLIKETRASPMQKTITTVFGLDGT
jgi:hypothetical protein